MEKDSSNLATGIEKSTGSERSSPLSPKVPNDSRASSLSGKKSHSIALPTHHPPPETAPKVPTSQTKRDRLHWSIPHPLEKHLPSNRKTMAITHSVSKMPKSLGGTNTHLKRDPGQSQTLHRVQSSGSQPWSGAHHLCCHRSPGIWWARLASLV